MLMFFDLQINLILVWLLWNELERDEVEHHVDRYRGQYHQTRVRHAAPVQGVQRQRLLPGVDTLPGVTRGARKVEPRYLRLTQSLESPLEVRDF